VLPGGGLFSDGGGGGGGGGAVPEATLSRALEVLAAGQAAVAQRSGASGGGGLGAVGGVVLGAAFALTALPTDATRGGWARIAAHCNGRFRLEFSDGTACAARAAAVKRAVRTKLPPPEALPPFRSFSPARDAAASV